MVVPPFLEDLPWLGVGDGHVVENPSDVFGGCTEKVGSVDDPVASRLAGLDLGSSPSGIPPVADLRADGEGLLSEKGSSESGIDL